MRYIDPETQGVHPLRLKMDDDAMAEIMQGIADNKDWMTMDEIEAAADYLYDVIVTKKQTHEGVTTLQ